MIIHNLTDAGLKPYLEILLDEARSHNSALPVSKLPLEILSQIFEEGPHENLPDVRLHPARVPLAPNPLPLILSHVCKMWRDIATQDPLLWTMIRLDSSKSTDLANLYLERSQSQELEIQAIIRDVASAHMFGVIVPQMHRCRVLVISFTDYAPAFATLDLLRDSKVPALRTCEILVETDTANELGEVQLFSGGAPLLSFVKLDGISALGCGIPLKFITQLDLKISHFGRKLFFWEFASILHETSTILTHLALEGIVIEFHPDHHLTPIQFPALTVLNLRLPFAHDGPLEWDDGDYVYNLWGLLVVPSLERLTLFNFSDEQFHDTMAALMWQRESAGTNGIRYLSLDAIGLRSGIEDLALACPNIIELTMRGLIVQPILSLLSDTSIRLSAPTHTPNLSDPDVEFSALRSLSVSTSNDKLLRAVVLARNAAAAPITTLRLCGKRSWSEHTVQWFRERVFAVSTHDEIFS